MSKVAISGASGFVGRNVARYLEGIGFEVVSLVRGKRPPFGRAVVTRDLAERSIIPQVKGSSALVHLIGTGRQTAEEGYDFVNVQLTRNAVALCKRSGVRKIIYFSGLGAGRDSTLGYFISKFKAEREIVSSGLDYTIFRPSYIMGGGDPLSTVLLRQAARGTVIIPGSGRYRLQPIHVNDAARVVSEAISGRKFSRKIIDLVGPKTVSYGRLVGDLVGRSRIRHIDFEKAYHEALVSGDSPFGVDDLSILVGGYVGNHGRLARISGLRFRKYGEMLQSCRPA